MALNPGYGTPAPAYGAPTPAPPRPRAAGINVRGMQQFLAAHGYNIAVDGVNGPITQAAAADFRGSRNAKAFNVGHGLIHDVPPASTDTSSSGGSPPPAVAPRPRLPQPRPAAPAGAARTAAPGQRGGSGLSQARAYVNALLNPVIQQITNAENARASSGMNAIRGYTSAEQNLLAQYAPAAASEYGGAVQSQSAIDAALRSQLAGQGGAQADELAGKLAAISADPQTAARLNAAATGTATGAANTNYAVGSSSLSALNQQGAGAQDYARAQPGIAGLAGLQSSRALQSQVSHDLSSQLGDLSSKTPGLIQQVVAGIQNAKTAQQRNRIAALIAAGKTNEALKIVQMNNDTRVSIANANNATRTQIAASRDEITKAQATTKDRLAFAKTFGYDPVTGKLIAGYAINGKGQVVKIAAAPQQPRLTAKERQTYMGTAATIAENARSGFQTTDPKTGAVTKHPAINWRQALDEMDKEGVPRPIAIQALNHYYTIVSPAGNPNAAGPPAPVR